MLDFIIFIFIISFLVFVHEFGHFILAKKAGVKVEEFGFGFPPRIWGKKKGDTLYSINAIPIGGFVKIYGEDPSDEESLNAPKSFNSKPLSIRALILLGGVIMNILVAVVIFYFLLGFSGFKSYQGLIYDYEFPFGTQENSAIISYVIDGYPAAEAGLEPFDIIISANGETMSNTDSFTAFIQGNENKEVSLIVKNMHTGNIKNISVVPRSIEEETVIGVGLSNIAEISYNSLPSRATVGFLHSFNLLHYSFSSLSNLVKTSFVEKSVEPLSRSMVGIVGIFAITKLTLALGVYEVLSLVALISLALAITNILPLPALDGGRLIFILYEFIAKKRAPIGLERNVNMIGFLILIFLSVLITYKDIIQFKHILF